jgi:hypothetical protein
LTQYVSEKKEKEKEEEEEKEKLLPDLTGALPVFNS